MYRFLGLDYGSKTVGVALSDPLLMSATGIEIIKRERENKLRKTLAHIEELVRKYDIDEIVLGYPINMDDSKGERVEKTLEFKEMLERRTSLNVILFDERLSSFEAHEIMNECGIKSIKHKEYVDEIAAMMILNRYLDSLSDDYKKRLISEEK